MRTFALALASLFIGSAVSAATLDFTDSIFASTFGDATPVVTTVGGVELTVTPTARGAAGWRQNTNGLFFGIPGNGMSSVTVVADADIEFVSFVAADRYPTLTGAPSYEALIDGVVVSQDNNTLGGVFQTFNFANGPLEVSEGSTFTFQPEFFGVLISGTVSSFDFNVITTQPNMSTVPLPAGMPLLLAALGAFAWVRRRQI